MRQVILSFLMKVGVLLFIVVAFIEHPARQLKSCRVFFLHSVRNDV